LFDADNPPSDSTLLQRMLSRSASLLQARGCGVLLWDRDKNQIQAMVPFAGLEEDQVKALEFPVGGAALAPVVLQDRAVMLGELADSQPDVLHFKQMGLQNVVGVPLALERRDEANTVSEREIMGICCAFDKHYGRSFDQEDAKLLAMMARQVSAVLVTSRLYWDAVQQRRKLIAAIESMAVGLIAISPNGTITQLNAAARKALGISGDWFGRYYAEVIQNDEMRHVVAQSFDTQISKVRELTIEEPNDRIYRVQSEPIAAEDKQTLGWVVVLEDITDIRQSEQMMAAFVDIVSHELRTPLTSIRGFVATLLQAGEGVFDWETQAEFLGIVDTEAERLGQMIDDLLNIARLQRGRGLQFNFQNIDMAAIVERVVRLQSSSFRGHVIDLQVAELPHLTADESKIQQVVTNLVSNAIKYSPNGGTITITGVEAPGPGELCEQRGIRVSIQDQGMGIPPDALGRMFTRFFRVEGSHMSGIKGTGLGLWLIKHFIEGHGGAIWVESDFGHGSTFSFWLPFNPPENNQPVEEDNGPILPKAA
jgi:two-component system, OmpR family, phosphate regulon sensor histidine kinase PhoR